MNEYRRAKRRKVGNIDVLDTMTGMLIGKLSNLSETGMLLILHEPLASDALFQLRFSLDDASGKSRQVEVGAHELWSDEAAAPEDVAFIREWVDAPGSQYV